MDCFYSSIWSKPWGYNQSLNVLIEHRFQRIKTDQSAFELTFPIDPPLPSLLLLITFDPTNAPLLLLITFEFTTLPLLWFTDVLITLLLHRGVDVLVSLLLSTFPETFPIAPLLPPLLLLITFEPTVAPLSLLIPFKLATLPLLWFTDVLITLPLHRGVDVLFSSLLLLFTIRKLQNRFGRSGGSVGEWILNGDLNNF